MSPRVTGAGVSGSSAATIAPTSAGVAAQNRSGDQPNRRQHKPARRTAATPNSSPGRGGGPPPKAVVEGARRE